MRLTWWHSLVALLALDVASPQTFTPTICEEDFCHCDSFTRVICSCSSGAYNEITLRPDGAYRVPQMASAIIISDCTRVFFLPDTVRGLLQLRNVEMKNIQYIFINERALAWSPFPGEHELPGLRISITNSTIREISSHAVQGRVDDIVISNSRVNNLKPFAFSSLTNVKNIALKDNVYDNIEIQAFKKFTTVNFALHGGVIRSLPSRFLSDVEVTNTFSMEKVTVDYIHSLAFLVSSPKRVMIEDNVIGALDGDGFHIVARGPILIRNNTVFTLQKGALHGFTVDNEVSSVLGPQDMIIENNTINEVSPSSLVYKSNGLKVQINDLNLNRPCACELAEEWRELVRDGAIINCWYDLESRYTSLQNYVESRCGTFKKTFWIFVVIGVLLVLLVAAVVIFFIVRRENEKKKKVQIVMPDGKTYRETEFHIVVERAELLTTDL